MKLKTKLSPLELTQPTHHTGIKKIRLLKKAPSKKDQS
jgi:hypothetical protein